MVGHLAVGFVAFSLLLVMEYVLVVDLDDGPLCGRPQHCRDKEIIPSRDQILRVLRLTRLAFAQPPGSNAEEISAYFCTR
jgi:hypothetical protein